MNAIGIEMNCAYSAIESRVVVLATRGDRDDLGLDVLCDHPHLFQGEIAVGEAGQRRRGGDHQSRGSGDAGAGGRFGIGFDQQSFLGGEELQQAGGQGKTKAARRAQRVKAGEKLFLPGVERAHVDALSLERSDPARGLNVEGKIQGQRAGMEKIERPQVDGAARQIGAAGRLGDNGWTARVGRFRHGLFVPRLTFVAPTSWRDADATGLLPPPEPRVSRCLHRPPWCDD